MSRPFGEWAACALAGFLGGVVAESVARDLAGVSEPVVLVDNTAMLEAARLAGENARLRGELTDARAEADGLRRAATERPDAAGGERIPATNVPER